MKKSNLISILSTFSREEMKKFGQFVASPYFHTGRNLKPLYLLLRENYPEFRTEKLTEEKIFRKLYPNKKFDKKKSSLAIRVLFAEMTAIAKQFLTFEKFINKDKGYSFNRLQFEALIEKGLTENSFKIMMETSSLLNEGEKVQDYELKRFDTNMMLAFSLYTMDRREESFAYLKTNVLYIYAVTFDQLDSYIQIAFSIWPYNKDFEGIELIKQFLSSFDIELFNRECPADDFGTKDLILFHFYFIKSCLDDEDKQSLMNVLKLYYELYGKIEKQDKLNHYVVLSNILYRRRKLDKIYIEKASELFDFALDSGMFGISKLNFNQIYAYLDILKIKAYLFDAETLATFIKKNQVRIPADILPDVINFSYAFYYFKKDDFYKCLECISKNDRLSEREMANKYKLKICSLYELGHFEEAIYALDSFKHYLKRDRLIGPNTRAEHLDFIESAQNLFRLKNNERAGTMKIKDTIRFSFFGDWLKQKVDALNK